MRRGIWTRRSIERDRARFELAHPELFTGDPWPAGAPPEQCGEEDYAGCNWEKCGEHVGTE
jgi:hypothetical protein